MPNTPTPVAKAPTPAPTPVKPVTLGAPAAPKPGTAPAPAAASQTAPKVATPPARTTEPAGAARFTAVSYPNAPVTAAAPAPAALTLEERVAALEAVVNEIAPYSRNAEHPGVVSWLKTVGARIKADVAKVKKAV